MASFLIAVDNAEVSLVKTLTLGGGWGKALLVAASLTLWNFDVFLQLMEMQGHSGRGSWLGATD